MLFHLKDYLSLKGEPELKGTYGYLKQAHLRTVYKSVGAVATAREGLLVMLIVKRRSEPLNEGEMGFARVLCENFLKEEDFVAEVRGSLEMFAQEDILQEGPINPIASYSEKMESLKMKKLMRPSEREAPPLVVEEKEAFSKAHHSTIYEEEESRHEEEMQLSEDRKSPDLAEPATPMWATALPGELAEQLLREGSYMREIAMANNRLVKRLTFVRRFVTKLYYEESLGDTLQAVNLIVRETTGAGGCSVFVLHPRLQDYIEVTSLAQPRAIA